MRWRALVACLVLLACGPDTTTPLGEALIVVDTDALVPGFVSRLRLDVYTADGSTWYDSRDIYLPDPTSWPASFAVYAPDMQQSRNALVRIRLYRSGLTQSYVGERFVPRSGSTHPAESAFPPPPPNGTPRLVNAMSEDVTPAEEPQPLVTIDQLLQVHVDPGVLGKIVVTMRSACFGTMADFANQRTCIDTDGVLVPVTTAMLDPNMTLPKPVPKVFGAVLGCPTGVVPYTGLPGLLDAQVCVPGGAFILGDTTLNNEGELLSSVPLQVVSVSPFLVDKYEVTVARWRFARDAGFKPPNDPQVNSVPLDQNTCDDVPATDTRWCTWTTAPGSPENREHYPLNCLSWEAARAFCAFEGGDLPTEAQWEYVAQVAGASDATAKRTYPWGESSPTCFFGSGPGRAVVGLLDSCSVGGLEGRDACVESNPNGQCTGPANLPNCGCGEAKSAPNVPLAQRQCNDFHPSSPLTLTLPQGPQPADLVDDPMTGDVGYGSVVDLYGGVSELLRDTFDAFDSNCWVSAPRTDPVCADPTTMQHSVRGASWEYFPGNGLSLLVGSDVPAQRWGDETYDATARANGHDHDWPEVGFRCAYPVKKP